MTTPQKERRVGTGRRQSDHEDTLEIQVKEKIVTPIFLLLCLSVALNAIGLLGIGFLNNDTNEAVGGVKTIVEDIERQQSPEAIAAEQELLDSIILRVECGSREAFEDALNSLLDQLENQEILEPGTVEVLDSRCEDVVLPSETTTTTVP